MDLKETSNSAERERREGQQQQNAAGYCAGVIRDSPTTLAQGYRCVNRKISLSVRPFDQAIETIASIAREVSRNAIVRMLRLPTTHGGWAMEPVDDIISERIFGLNNHLCHPLKSVSVWALGVILLITGASAYRHIPRFRENGSSFETILLLFAGVCAYSFFIGCRMLIVKAIEQGRFASDNPDVTKLSSWTMRICAMALFVILIATSL